MPRPASIDHLLAQPWARTLTSAQQQRLAREAIERHVPRGTAVCRSGEPVSYWKGVVDGLVKLSVAGSDGRMSTLTGLRTGAWFGEGPVLRSQPWDYDGVALRDTTLVLVPRSTFLWLVRDSAAFNDFVLGQLAERLAQFVAIIEAERLEGAPVRVARCLAWLFNPVLYPGNARRLDLTQQEIAYLSGVTRQRVNLALRSLERAELLVTGYGTVEVLDLPGLLAFRG